MLVETKANIHAVSVHVRPSSISRGNPIRDEVQLFMLSFIKKGLIDQSI